MRKSEDQPKIHCRIFQRLRNHQHQKLWNWEWPDRKVKSKGLKRALFWRSSPPSFLMPGWLSPISLKVWRFRLWRGWKKDFKLGIDRDVDGIEWLIIYQCWEFSTLFCALASRMLAARLLPSRQGNGTYSLEYMTIPREET